MELNASTRLLGGLSPAQFMRRHWEKKPLVVRQSWPGIGPPVSRARMFELAARDDVESRLVVRTGGDWQVRHGPLKRRTLPALSQPGWTLLVQGLDLHADAARAMLEPFRFVPEARLDDLMMSWASDGGGVGPHVDAYDVFLLQVQGRRRWCVGRVDDDRFIDGLPLRILRRFEPEHEWVLEPGDLLYLPPLWGHDGIADGPCMTCSVGFRSPRASELGAELLQRLADGDCGAAMYRDATQAAVAEPARIPAALAEFASSAVEQRLRATGAVARALGEALTEPKPRVWFDEVVGAAPIDAGVRLDRRSRMLYDDRHVYLNGESYRIGSRDAALMRKLADRRSLDRSDCTRLSAEAREVMQGWLDDGWLQPQEA